MKYTFILEKHKYILRIYKVYKHSSPSLTHTHTHTHSYTMVNSRTKCISSTFRDKTDLKNTQGNLLTVSRSLIQIDTLFKKYLEKFIEYPDH